MKDLIKKLLSNRFTARIFGETVLVVNLTRRTWRIEDRFRGQVFIVRPEERIVVSLKESIVDEVHGIEFEIGLSEMVGGVDLAKEGTRDITKTFNPGIPKSMECKLDSDLLRHCDQVLRDHDRPVVESPGFRINEPHEAREKLTEVCSRCGKKVSLFDVAYLGPKDRESTDGHPGQDLVTICLQCETEDERIERFEVNQR